MKKSALLLLMLLAYLASNAQNYKALQISDMKIGVNYYPVHVLQDSEASSYFVYWTGNGQIISDTVFIHKFSSSGQLISTLKINSLYGGLSNSAFQKLGTDKFILAVGFTDSIKVQNQVYKVRYNQNNQVGVQGSILIVFNKNLEILNHKFIGLGVNHFIQSISVINQFNYLIGMRFTDTLDTRPCGGDLFVVSEMDTIIGEHLNFALAELDLAFNLNKIVKSNSLNQTEISGNSGNVGSKKIFSVCYSREDSLRVGNLKFSPELNFTPLLFTLNNDLGFYWNVSGKFSINSTSNDDGFINCIVEDINNNFILCQNTFGRFNFGTTEIGKSRDVGTAFVKFDSLGNIFWSKTFSTRNGVASSADINLNPQKDKFLFTNALQDTFSIGNFNFLIPKNSTQKGIIAELSLSGDINNVHIIGYDQLNAGLNYLSANMDSLGNTYAIFATNTISPFTTDCFTLPALSSLQNDSSRLVWLKFGPSALKRDTILKRYDICTGLGKIEARYKTQYPGLQYFWNGQPADSIINFSQGGNYQLIVKDATCWADTVNFNFPLASTIPQPPIFGSNSAGNIGALPYYISVPDSLNIIWEVIGGNLISGQGTDSILVHWNSPGLGIVAYTLTGEQSGCQHRDSLIVLVTASNSIISKSGKTTVYPNPTDNSIIVSTQCLEEITYSLINANGKVVATGKIIGSQYINMKDLLSGIYTIHLRSSTLIDSIQVVKR